MTSRTVSADFPLASVVQRDVVYAILGSLFIACCAQLSMALPFTMVPVTFQAQAILLTAAVLGARRGFYATLAYLLEGALGLPVFAEGYGGYIWFFTATGGYLWSYLPVSILVGLLVDTVAKSQLAVIASMLLGNAIVLVMGTAWLGFFVGPENAWTMGAAPFLVADVLKIVMALCLFPAGRSLAQWGHGA